MEKNYSATELEALGVVWACEQFRPYLYGRKFVIECDHNPLVFIDKMKNKTSRVSRWRYNLSEFQYKIEYVKRSLNVKANTLSRAEILSVESITSQIIKAQSKDVNLSEIKQHPPTNFFVENGILFKKADGRNRIVIPESMKENILTNCHDDMSGGHLGFKKTWPKICSRFYWKIMYKDTENWIKGCKKCAQRKTPKQISKI